MQWIDKRSILRTKQGKTIRYGDELPRDLDPKFLARLVKEKKAGELPPAPEKKKPAKKKVIKPVEKVEVNK